MRRTHDIGGLKAGPVRVAAHELRPWEKESQAIFNALSAPRRALVSIHMLRRSVEDLPAGDYWRLGYFERRCQALANLLIEHGLLTGAELARRGAEIAARRSGTRPRKRLKSSGRKQRQRS